MTTKIAVTGSHGTGKSYIVSEVTRKLRREGYSVLNIPSPTREVVKLGFKNNEGGSWQTQYLCAAKRIFSQKEVEEQAELMEVDFVISDRCLLDEFIYTSRLAQSYAVSGGIVLPKNTYDYVKVDELTRMIKEFWEDDLESYWDAVYYKPIHLDYLPEEDGYRSGNVNFQSKIDGLMRSQINFLNYKEEETIKWLPEDRDEAAKVLFEEAQLVREVAG